MNKTRHIPLGKRTPVGLLKHSPNNGKHKEHLIHILFPTLHFIKELVRHIGRDSICHLLFATIWIFANNYRFDNVTTRWHKTWIGTSSELHCCGRKEWKLNIGSFRPRISLNFPSLLCQLSPLLHILSPFSSGYQVSFKPLLSLVSNFFKFFLIHMLCKV